MARRYISSKSTYFYPVNAQDPKFKLIYGDEVETLDVHDQNTNRDRVIYRRRDGWVNSDRLMRNHPLELYFIDVGQGDSTFIVTPGGRKILIDGGRGDEAFQFLVWRYRLDLRRTRPVDIDLLVITHTDDDHLAGLVPIVQHPLIRIKRIVHSGIAKYRQGFSTGLGNTVVRGQSEYLINRHDSLADLAVDNLTDLMICWRVACIAEQGLIYEAVDTRNQTIDIGDSSVTLHVLGPRLTNIPGHADPVYTWFGSEAYTVNGHSVVLMLEYQDVRILFPGDLNKIGQRYLMSDPQFIRNVNAHILKSPHHGSHDYDRSFLEAAHPQVSVISSGETPDHGHPRADFLGTIGNVSRSTKPLLYSTELVALFVVDDDAAQLDADHDANPTDYAMMGQARRRFKKRLNGIINVRTDGNDIYCARRVKAGYQFVISKQRARPRDP